MTLIALLKSKIIKDFSYALLGNLFYAGLVFFANALIARELGPTGFGDFSLLYTIIFMITIFSDFGLSISIAKFLPEYYSRNQEDKASNILNLSFIIKLVGSTIIAIIGIIFSWAISHYLLRDTRLLIPLIIVFIGGIGLSLYELLSNLFQAKQEFLTYSVYVGLRGFFIFSFILILVFSSSLSILTSIVIFSFVPTVIFLLTLILNSGFNISDISLKLERENLLEFIKFNFYLIIANIASIFISRIDIFYINFFLGSESVGYYSVASQLIQIIIIITNSLTLILLPKVSELTSLAEIRQAFYGILKYSLLLFMGIFPFILSGPFLITLIYSPSYEPAIFLFQLLAFGFGMSLIINPLSTLVYKFNKPKIIALMVVVRLLLILIFEPLFLIFFQLSGVGFVTILNFSFALTYIIVYLFLAFKHRKRVS